MWYIMKKSENKIMHVITQNNIFPVQKKKIMYTLLFGF